MSDDLLPRRAFAVLPPEPGGFEAALARGRRRRRRTTGSGVLASIVAVALAVSLTGTSPDTDARLEFAPVVPGELDDDRDARSADLPDAEPIELGEVPQPDSGAAPADIPAAAPAETGAVAAGPVAQPRARTRTAAAPARGRRLDPPAESDVADGHVSCTTVSGTAPSRVTRPWCLMATYELTDNTGDPGKPEDPGSADETFATLSISVCLRVEAASTNLTFDGEQQVDFEIFRTDQNGTVGGKALWKWSHLAAFNTSPTKDAVTPGDCRMYSVRWKGLADNDGYFVGEGTYQLRAKSLAFELGQADTATATFSI